MTKILLENLRVNSDDWQIIISVKHRCLLKTLLSYSLESGFWLAHWSPYTEDRRDWRKKQMPPDW